MTLPLGWLTDLAVLRSKGAEVSEHTDHLVVRSPDNPDYHWGNLVLVTDEAAVDDAARWLAVFERAHPGAAHRAIGLVAAPDPEPWTAAGLDVETEDVLATDRLPVQRPCPSGYAVRELVTDADWAAQTAAAVRENDRTVEHEALAHARFAAGRARSRRRIVAEGRGAWFGAFDARGTLVADLGVVDCGGGVARFQDVGTDVVHRRRGLAGHLVGLAAAWAQQHGAERWVILTEPDNPAGRLYRSLGFVPATASAQAYRRPTGASSSGPDSSDISDSEAL